jgi:hypothetical protein
MRTKDLSEQTGIKASDNVVCIGDTYQRLDLADAPDGFADPGSDLLRIRLQRLWRLLAGRATATA